MRKQKIRNAVSTAVMAITGMIVLAMAIRSFIPSVKRAIVIDDGYAAAESSDPSSETAQSETVLININTATRRELQKLDGIGETTARAIIDYRDEHGAFASVDDLINVKGIGEKTLEKLRGSITV